MKNFTFRKELVEAQDELLRFAYKLQWILMKQTTYCRKRL